jgi:hypothetical protein
MLRQIGHESPGREAVRESRDGLPADREVFEMVFGLPQPALQFGDLRA